LILRDGGLVGKNRFLVFHNRRLIANDRF
jgi:hypothetical protein